MLQLRNFATLSVGFAVSLVLGCGGGASSGDDGAAGAGSGGGSVGAAGASGAAVGAAGTAQSSGGSTAAAGSPSNGGAGTSAGGTSGNGGTGTIQPTTPAPKACTDETELGASTPSSGARVVKLSANSPGKTAALVGFSATDVDVATNDVLWARFSGATGFRSFGRMDPQSADNDNVSSQSTFLAARSALIAAGGKAANVDWAHFTPPTKIAGVLPMVAAVGAAMVIEIKVPIGSIPLVGGNAPTSASALWKNKWEVWKTYFSQAFIYAKNYGVSRFEIYNEPDLSSVTDYDPVADYTVRAELAGDAIQAAVHAANSSLVPLVVGPTSATGSTDWGSALASHIKDDELGNPATDANYTLFQGYGYHNYSSDGLGSYNSIRSVQKAALAPASLTLPFFITEFDSACSNCEKAVVTGNKAAYPDALNTYAADVPEFARRLPEKAIGYSEANVGPMNLFAFNFLSTIAKQDDGTLAITNNGLYWADGGDANANPSTIGGDSNAASGYRLLITHFSGEKSRLDLDVGAATGDKEAPDTAFEAAYDDQYGAYAVLASNRATTSQKVFFDFSALALPAGSTATVIDVGASHHGEITHRITLSAASTLEITQEANAITLVTVPKTAGTVVSIGAAADTTVAPGEQSGTRFGTDQTLALAADSTNTSKLRAALLAFDLPDLGTRTLGDAMLELTLTPDSMPSADVLHIYGVSDSNWTDDATNGARWSDVSNLRTLAAGSKYAQIADNPLQFLKDGKLDPALRVAATALLSSTSLRVDLTDYVKEAQKNSQKRLSLLIVREVNHHTEVINFSAKVRSRESDCGGPVLSLRAF